MGYLVLYYCDKCGDTSYIAPGQLTICGVCQNTLKVIPDSYLNENEDISKEMEQKLIEDLVITSPNFDQYYFDNRNNIRTQQIMEDIAREEYGKAIQKGRNKGNKFGVTCPYCSATNVKKITTTSKAVHTALFGVFSMGRNSKNYHCNHCGSDF